MQSKTENDKENQGGPQAAQCTVRIHRPIPRPFSPAVVENLRLSLVGATTAGRPISTLVPSMISRLNPEAKAFQPPRKIFCMLFPDSGPCDRSHNVGIIRYHSPGCDDPPMFLVISFASEEELGLMQIHVLRKNVVYSFQRPTTTVSRGQDWPRKETLALMNAHGIANVRGPQFSSVILTRREVALAKEMIRVCYSDIMCCSDEGAECDKDYAHTPWPDQFEGKKCTWTPFDFEFALRTVKFDSFV